jgi:hypothetical protein
MATWGSWSSTQTTKVWSTLTGWSNEEQFCIYAYWRYRQAVDTNQTEVILDTLRFQETRQLCLAYCVVTFEGGWSGSTASGTATLTQTFGPPYYVDVTINKSKVFNNNSDGYATGLYFQWRCSVSGNDYRVPKQSSLNNYEISSNSIPRLYLTSSLSMDKSSAAMSGSSSDKVTFIIGAQSSSYTHKLLYSFKNASGYISSSVAAGTTSVTWTPPLSLNNQIPNSTSDTCTITLETYSGSTKVGSTTKNLTLTVPSSIVPSISSVSLSDAAGLYSTYSAYVASKSKLKADIKATGSYSSSISAISVKVIDTYYSGTVSNSSGTYSASITSGYLTAATNSVVTVTVTDSRGRTATNTSNKITVLAYSAPNGSISYARITSDGTVDDDGTYIKYTWNYTISSLNSKNTRTVKIQMYSSSKSAWVDVATVTNGYTRSSTTNDTTNVYSTEYNYSARLAITDKFTTTYKNITIAPSFRLIHWGNDGRSMGIGKRAENANCLEIGLSTKISAGLEVKNGNVCVTHGNAFNQIISDVTSGTAPSSDLWRYPIAAFDSTWSNYLMYLEVYAATSKFQRVRLAGRSKMSGSTVDGYIDIRMNANGTVTYYTGNGQIADSSTYASVIPAATTSKNGLMSSSDKTKIDKLDSYGASSWEFLRTCGGNNTKGTQFPFTLDSSIENYNEIMVMCVQNKYYTAETGRVYFVLGTTIVPKALVKDSYVDIADGTFGTPEANGYHAGVSFTSATTGYLYAYYSDARCILFAR